MIINQTKFKLNTCLLVVALHIFVNLTNSTFKHVLILEMNHTYLNFVL